MKYWVYILFSEKLGKFYIGTTTDVKRRVDEHNNGHYKTSFSTKGIPWSLFLAIECSTSDQAYTLERFIKKMKSAAFIRRLKNDHSNIDSIIKKIERGEIN